MPRLRFKLAILAIALAVLGGTALAQQEGDGEGDGGETPATEKPWSQGVPPESRTAASALYKEGNALLRDSFFVQAVEKYREAVALWDHPSIHYNLAIGLINLDQPLEVYASLLKALSYDAAALSVDEVELATRYKKLVEQQIVELTVTCDLEGAQVFIDGKEAFIAPGKETRLVRAGEHTFTATKDGYETTAVTRILAGGTPEAVSLSLFRPEDLTRYKRKFKPWLPYVVTGAGALVAGIGGLLHASALSDFDEFDASVERCEAENNMACEITPAMNSLRSGGSTKQTIAVISYAIGGAAVVAGVTLVLLNRPKPYRIDREDVQQGTDGVAVVPVLGRDHVGVAAAFRF